jgi:hypothetical protein
MDNEEDDNNKVVVITTPTISELMADNIKYKINNELLLQKLAEFQKIIYELKKEIESFKKFEPK